mmetsp:Transcript_15441/g.27446  ORF Transcript_15441/g.27446 Transcript_15441/m.27446 type:complete len:99 (-) Transcript_15441:723-1019(-)
MHRDMSHTVGESSRLAGLTLQRYFFSEREQTRARFKPSTSSSSSQETMTPAQRMLPFASFLSTVFHEASPSDENVTSNAKVVKCLSFTRKENDGFGFK